MENRYIVNYDIKQKCITNVKFKQGDIDSSVLEIHLKDNGITIDLTGEAIEFRFLKPDEAICFQDSTAGVTITDATNGVVECILKSDTLAAVGSVRCDIHRTKDGKALTVPSFNFTVESSIDGSGVASTNYISALDNYEATINGFSSQLADIVDQISISAVANNFNLDIGHSANKKFKIETTDTNAKTIILTNAPTNCEITIKLKYTSAATFNATAGVTWKDGVTPVFTVGKIYFLYLITDDGGTTWQGVWTGAW